MSHQPCDCARHDGELCPRCARAVTRELSRLFGLHREIAQAILAPTTPIPPPPTYSYHKLGDHWPDPEDL